MLGRCPMGYPAQGALQRCELRSGHTGPHRSTYRLDTYYVKWQTIEYPTGFDTRVAPEKTAPDDDLLMEFRREARRFREGYVSVGEEVTRVIARRLRGED